MRPSRHIRKLSQEEVETLQELYRQTHNADVRTRCQMILLSSEGYSTTEIAGITMFDQDTVLHWFDRYEAEGSGGLKDRPRSGRPPKSGRGV